MDRAEKIIELSKEIAKEIKEKYNPHTSVIIECDRVRVEETVIGVPISECWENDL